jgi:hypothetical protein
VTALEDALRQTLAAQVEPQPAMGDPATAAIRRARGIQRWRVMSAGVAVALVLSLVLGGAMSLRDQVVPTAGDEPAGPPVTMPGQEPVSVESEPMLAQRAMAQSEAQLRLIGLDLRVGHQLWTLDGKRLQLTGVGLVTRVYRVAVGWVYGGAEHVRLLRPDGNSVLLHSGGDGWLVSPDGSRLAVVKDGRLEVSAIADNGLKPGAAIPVPAGASPVAFAGDHVVIQIGAAGPYDTLVPPAAYRATANKAVVAVYGSAAGTLFGMVRRDKTLCLAALKAADTGLIVAETGGCTAAAVDVARSRLAPDGRHLAEPARERVLLLNLTQTLGGDRVAVVCPVATVVAPAWVDGTTVVAAGRRAMVRCRTDGTSQELPMPEGLTSDWDFVPALNPTQAG